MGLSRAAQPTAVSGGGEGTARDHTAPWPLAQASRDAAPRLSIHAGLLRIERVLHLGSSGAAPREGGGEEGCSTLGVCGSTGVVVLGQRIPPAFLPFLDGALSSAAGWAVTPEAPACLACCVVVLALLRLAEEGCLDVCVISCGQCKPFP